MLFISAFYNNCRGGLNSFILFKTQKRWRIIDHHNEIELFPNSLKKCRHFRNNLEWKLESSICSQFWSKTNNMSLNFMLYSIVYDSVQLQVSCSISNRYTTNIYCCIRCQLTAVMQCIYGLVTKLFRLVVDFIFAMG